MDVKKSSGLTFDIVLDENVTKPEPNRMILLKNKQKKPLTADEIEKRQRKAEERRQARIEARLKKMQEREEATRSLACKVDKLLQQQSLRTGQQPNPDNLPIMSHQEIMKTAYDVVKGFNKMQQQLLNIDLKVDKQNQPMSQMSELQKISKSNRNAQGGTIRDLLESQISLSDSSTAEQKPRGVVFEIPSDVKASKRRSKKPPIARLQNKDSRQRNDQEMAAIKLEVKQQQAAERRQQRIDNKVQKTRESREALMELQTKMNIFQEHQAAVEGKADSHMILSEHEAACLAHDIADGFSNIHSRYKADLERAEGFFMVYDKKLM